LESNDAEFSEEGNWEGFSDAREDSEALKMPDPFRPEAAAVPKVVSDFSYPLPLINISIANSKN
jgi:hypothetical protein